MFFIVNYCIAVSSYGARGGLVQAGTCLVYRAPSLRIENLRKLKSVSRPELLEWLPAGSSDCIVFSTKGARSVTDTMAGGDLDGDPYLVIFEPTVRIALYRKLCFKLLCCVLDQRDSRGHRHHGGGEPRW